MHLYIVRRLVVVPLLLFSMSILVFGMMQFLSPVARAALYVEELPKSEEALDAVITTYQLDDPFYLQYWHWLVGIPNSFTGEVRGGVLRGDLGFSVTSHQPITDIIRERFPATVELVLWSILPIVGTGLAFGIFAAIYHNRACDQSIRLFSISGSAIPTFVFGLLMLLVFYLKLHWITPGRASDWVMKEIYAGLFPLHSGILTLDALINGRPDVFWDAFSHLVLPVVTVSYINWVIFVRVTRSSLLEEFGQEYMVTARSKGLSTWQSQIRHALPNALLPIVTLFSGTLIGLMNGVVIVETIYLYPGIGGAAAKAAGRLDIVTVLGLTLFTGTIMILINLFNDVMLAIVDPRIRFE